MYSKENTFEKQVFIGPFLGPFMALLTMAIVLFHQTPTEMELPLTGLVGLFCSWKWRLKGTAIAWVLLTAVTGFKLVSAPEAPLWWNITLAASIAMACVVMALTQRNIRDHLEWKYQDSIEQQGRLAIVEGRLNTILQTINQERADYQKEIESLKEELKEKTGLYASNLEYVDIARTELLRVQKENESLHREALEFRQDSLAYQRDLELATNQLKACQKNEEEFKECRNELNELKHTLQAYQHQISSYRDDLYRAKQQQPIIHEMGELIETLSREKTLLESSLSQLQGELETLRETDSSEFEVTEESPAELRRLHGFYSQLREQFEEKSRVLDETRREFFQTQEKLYALQKEVAERELESPQISFQEHMQALALGEEKFEKELELARQEIGGLYEMVNNIVK